jgi:hypothetical protein
MSDDPWDSYPGPDGGHDVTFMIFALFGMVFFLVISIAIFLMGGGWITALSVIDAALCFWVYLSVRFP